MGGEVRWGEKAFQGKGFRSLGQEAIYAGGDPAAARRGAPRADGTWSGDVVAPVIRDLGMTLAMRSDEEAVRQVLSAQMGKAGPPMDGKDLHIGDWAWGVLPAAAPLAIGSLTIAGLAMGFWREGSGRVAFSFIGEGGSSLGEWHEAINLCAARKLPAVFCVQNNQTALSTPVPRELRGARLRRQGRRLRHPGHHHRRHRSRTPSPRRSPGRPSGRARGRGRRSSSSCRCGCAATRITTTCSISARSRTPSWDYPPLHDGGYADRERYEFWAKRDPIARYAARLEADKVVTRGDARRDQARGRGAGRAAGAGRHRRAVAGADEAGVGVFADEPPRTRIEVLDPDWRLAQSPDARRCRRSSPARRSTRRAAPSSRR